MMFDSFETYDVQETRRVSREEGHIAGKIEGKIEGKIDDILELLEELGAVPDEMREAIERETDLKTLSRWLKQAAKARSLEEFVLE